MIEEEGSISKAVDKAVESASSTSSIIEQFMDISREYLQACDIENLKKCCFG